MLAGCASPGLPTTECATVTVHSQVFEDVVVYLEAPPRRLGLVRGHGSTVFRVCHSQAQTTFRVRAVGGRFDEVLRGSHIRIVPGDDLEVIIAPVPGMSRVIGTAVGAVLGLAPVD